MRPILRPENPILNLEDVCHNRAMKRDLLRALDPAGTGEQPGRVLRAGRDSETLPIPADA